MLSSSHHIPASKNASRPGHSVPSDRARRHLHVRHLPRFHRFQGYATSAVVLTLTGSSTVLPSGDRPRHLNEQADHPHRFLGHRPQPGVHRAPRIATPAHTCIHVFIPSPHTCIHVFIPSPHTCIHVFIPCGWGIVT